MFVGEAPGANEDRLGLPFVGQAGALLERLLGEIGMRRDDVFIANVLKCRPPGNRDPLPHEIDNCQEYLFGQLELVRPRVVCTLGNFATKLLRADPATGITRLHGREEERVIGPLAVRLYPLLHPAAALYTPAMLAGLRADFQRIPELLARDRPALSTRTPDPAVTQPEVALAITRPASTGKPAAPAAHQDADSEDPEPPHAAAVAAPPRPAAAAAPTSRPHSDRDPAGADDPPAEAPLQLGLF